MPRNKKPIAVSRMVYNKQTEQLIEWTDNRLANRKIKKREKKAKQMNRRRSK